jgi:hypothetical protein
LGNDQIIELIERGLLSRGIVHAVWRFKYQFWNEWSNSGKTPEFAPTPKFARYNYRKTRLHSIFMVPVDEWSTPIPY